MFIIIHLRPHSTPTFLIAACQRPVCKIIPRLDLVLLCQSNVLKLPEKQFLFKVTDQRE
jgi:hypothetical protein